MTRLPSAAIRLPAPRSRGDAFLRNEPIFPLRYKDFFARCPPNEPIFPLRYRNFFPRLHPPAPGIRHPASGIRYRPLPSPFRSNPAKPLSASKHPTAVSPWPSCPPTLSFQLLIQAQTHETNPRPLHNYFGRRLPARWRPDAGGSPQCHQPHLDHGQHCRVGRLVWPNHHHSRWPCGRAERVDFGQRGNVDADHGDRARPALVLVEGFLGVVLGQPGVPDQWRDPSHHFRRNGLAGAELHLERGRPGASLALRERQQWQLWARWGLGGPGEFHCF